MTYDVSSGTLNPTISCLIKWCYIEGYVIVKMRKKLGMEVVLQCSRLRCDVF